MSNASFTRSYQLFQVLLLLGMVLLLLYPLLASWGMPHPACPFKAVDGRLCPSCGLTTSWQFIFQGEWAAAESANTHGIALFIMWLLLIDGRIVFLFWGPKLKHPFLTDALIAMIIILLTAHAYLFDLFNWLMDLKM